MRSVTFSSLASGSRAGQAEDSTLHETRGEVLAYGSETKPHLRYRRDMNLPL